MKIHCIGDILSANTNMSVERREPTYRDHDSERSSSRAPARRMTPAEVAKMRNSSTKIFADLLQRCQTEGTGYNARSLKRKNCKVV